MPTQSAASLDPLQTNRERSSPPSGESDRHTHDEFRAFDLLRPFPGVHARQEPHALPMPEYKRVKPDKAWAEDFHAVAIQAVAKGWSPVKGGGRHYGSKGECSCGWANQQNAGTREMEKDHKFHVQDEWNWARLGLSHDRFGEPQPTAFAVNVLPGSAHEAHWITSHWVGLGLAVMSFAKRWVGDERTFLFKIAEEGRERSMRAGSASVKNEPYYVSNRAALTWEKWLPVVFQKANIDVPFSSDGFEFERRMNQILDNKTLNVELVKSEDGLRESRATALRYAQLGYAFVRTAYELGWDFGTPDPKYTKQSGSTDKHNAHVIRPYLPQNDHDVSGPVIYFWDKLSSWGIMNTGEVEHWKRCVQAMDEAGYRLRRSPPVESAASPNLVAEEVEANAASSNSPSASVIKSRKPG